MLKQFSRLTMEADGRYATDSELQFLEEYLESAPNRLSAYEKIRDQEDTILQRIEKQQRAHKQDLFHMGDQDITDICKRDMTDVLRCATAAMLISDLDRLREGLLIWYQTLVRSFGYTPYAKINYQIIQDVVKLYLAPEEMALMLPALQLNQTILGT